MLKRLCRFSALLTLAVPLYSPLLYSQGTTTGTIQGTVADSTGGGIPQVVLVLRNVSTGNVRSIQTDDTGQFRFAGVSVGAYSLQASHEGFNPAGIDVLTLALGQTVNQRIVLSPASVTQKLDVQEQADALQTTATTEGISLGGERIEEAPAPNRNYLNFVLSAPAAAASAGSSTARSMAGLRNPANDSGFVFNGMRGRNNSITIDGVDNRDETTGGNRVAVGLEMVQDFHVAGTDVSAEFGGASGGLVNVVTHTGQNIWHGDTTFFLQNEALNARSPEVESSSARPLVRKYQPGVSAGGPIRRDRTFFFFALEQSWESTQEWSDAPRRNASLIERILGSAPFARAGVAAMIPGLFPSGESDTEFAINGTHLLNSNNTLSARYAFSRGRVDHDVQAGDNFTDFSARGNSLLTDNSLVLGWTSTLSPVQVNDLRLQLSQRSALLTPNSATGSMIEIPGVVTMGRNGVLDQQRSERHAEIVETFQWTSGRHLFSAGARVHSVFFDGQLANRFHGIYLFPDLNSFIAGTPDLAIQAFGDPHTNLTTTPGGFWLQDKWQLLAGLTVDAGVRYDRQWLPAAIPATNRNIAPRLGIAWHPGNTPNWVFRAGGGLFYDRYPLAYLNEAVQKNGTHGFEQYLTGPLAIEAFRLYQAGTMLQPIAGVPVSTYRASADFPDTYARKFTAGFERKIDQDTTLTVEASNVRGLHLPRIRNAALTVPPEYLLEQTANSAYQGISFALNRRMAKEFAYLITYNLGRTHDDSSDYDEQPFLPANIRQDWALSRQHQEHRITASGIFDLDLQDWNSAPALLRKGVAGFTLAPVFSWGSGRPLNTLLTTDEYGTGAFPITARPPGFARNSQFSPRTVSLDLRLMKTILIHHDRARFQFGVEAFNLMNHTNRLRLSPFYTSTYGALIEAQNPRQVQTMFQFEY